MVWKSLDLRNWEAANKVVRAWEIHGQAMTVSIEDASCTAFGFEWGFDSRSAPQLDRENVPAKHWVLQEGNYSRHLVVEAVVLRHHCVGAQPAVRGEHIPFDEMRAAGCAELYLQGKPHGLTRIV